MLATLFAHELRTQGRRTLIVLGLFSAVGLSAIALGLIPALSDVGASIAFGAFSAAPAVAIVLLFIGYWQSMYGTRGYFTFMLPARGRTIFFAKVLHIIGMSFVSIGVASLGFFLLCHTRGAEMWADERHFHHGHDFHHGHEDFDWHAMGHGTHVLFVLLGVFAAVGIIILVASIMSIGAHSRWSHMGFAAPVIGFIAYWMVGGLAGFAGMLLLPMGIRTADGAWVWQGMSHDILHQSHHGTPEVIGMGHIPVYAVMICATAVWAVRTIESHTSLR